MAEKKLVVDNLKISFRTMNGKVQAVRNVDFDLYKGETLAIVGESGSGKSVTSRAIMGILANNAIVESGKIIYDGQDLLKIDEESFHKIRGDKIAMIFQDPMSSLNPIMRIGKQLTEAMLLKNKARRRESRKTFNQYVAVLLQNMNEATRLGKSKTSEEENKKLIHDFNKFEIRHIHLEAEYNVCREACRNAIAAIEDLLFEIEKDAVSDLILSCNEIAGYLPHTIGKFVVEDPSFAGEIKQFRREYRAAAKSKDYSAVRTRLEGMLQTLKEAFAQEEPNFFGLGFYLEFVEKEIPDMPIPELNAYTHKILDEKFMLHFIDVARIALENSALKSYQAKKGAIEVLKQYLPVFEKEPLDKKEGKEAIKAMTFAVCSTIDPLALLKDSRSYIFESSMESGLEKYFAQIKKNEHEAKRFAQQTQKREALVAKGKEPDWQVVPADIVDPEIIRVDLIDTVKGLIDSYGKTISRAFVSVSEETVVSVVDFLKEKASGAVYKVTKDMAKTKALALMKEVGIPEVRKRFKQYPFEFSGGMRQRIVIAIALSADPDILICDEPTTALDVTIQAQILELINKIKAERHLSVIFITHNLGVVANMADRIAVMYAGKIVEYGLADDIFYDPRHPYTWALLSSMPDLDTKEKLEAIPGTPPNMIYPPKGDAFADRNKYALQIDYEMQPPMFRVSESHGAATWLLHPDAPKVEPPKIVTDRIARMKKLGGDA